MSNFYAENISFLQNHFNIDLESGLSHAEVEKLRELHGINEAKSSLNSWKLSTYFEQVFNWRLLLLVISSILVGLAGDYPSTILIGSIVVISLIWANIVVISLRIRHKHRKKTV